MKTIFLSSPYAVDYFAEKNRDHNRHATDNVKISIQQGFFRAGYQDNVNLANVSTHGAAICCPKFFPNGTKLRIKLIFESDREFSLKGRITRVQKEVPACESPPQGLLGRLFRKPPRLYSYGIQFEERPQEFADHLIKTGLRKKFSCGV